MSHKCKECGVIKSSDEFRVHKRGHRIGKCIVCEREYQRQWYRQNLEVGRARKREHMARMRAADPEAARNYAKADWIKNRQARLATMKSYQKRRFFWMRTMKLCGINAKGLALLWRKQRGLCALTGERLTRENAEVDHILPRKRGGGDEIANLRWTTKTANRMKRDMTDEEFFSACLNVMSWIGQRIEEVAA
jgi:5-methylcytosine-specific restriction endonuclease McrA